MNAEFYKNLSNVNDNVTPYSNQKVISDHAYDMALIVAFYNNIHVLKLTLASIEIQSKKNFIVIICDDGSRSEVVSELHRIIDQSHLPIIHLWHRDIGFRKNRMLNWAIQKSPSEYLVFIDQDCILHPEFLSEHFNNKKENTVLSGRRTDLTLSVSQQLTPEKIKSGFIQKNFWWIFFCYTLDER